MFASHHVLERIRAFKKDQLDDHLCVSYYQPKLKFVMSALMQMWTAGCNCGGTCAFERDDLALGIDLIMVNVRIDSTIVSCVHAGWGNRTIAGCHCCPAGYP